MNSMSPVALENDPVAVQWQSDIQVAKWQSIGLIGRDFGLSGTGSVSVAQEWSEWHSSGRVAVDWMASKLTEAKNLAEIEASDWSRAPNPAL